MTRTVLIIGLMLMAAFLPLAALPLALTVLVASLVFIAHVAPYVSSDAQPAALLALTFFRGPPSR